MAEKTYYSKLINENLLDFSRSVDKLRNIVRYATAPRNARETVAEHSFFVASYVLKLYEYYEFDLKKALPLALLHDYSEVYISDVPHPIKKKNPELEKALELAEDKVNREHLSDTYADWLHEFNDGSSVEGLVCDLGDVMSVVTYAKYEMDLGNKAYMKQVYEGSVDRYKGYVKQLEPYARENGPETTAKVIDYIEKIFSTKVENS